ncbi:MAG: 3-isopropylmalate dehydrogenase [Chloroflexota bacterium]
MQANITLLPGDGIGPEVVAECEKVFNAVGQKFNHTFEFATALIGGIAIDETGNPLPDESIALCKNADAVLLGAVGGPKWDDPTASVRPEQGLLKIRKALGLFANIRPVKIYPALADSSTLKPEVVSNVDMIIIRELTGGLYFGEPQGRQDTDAGRAAVDTLYYTEQEIERLVRVGFELAKDRRKKLTSVDKANVLASSRLWREIAHEVRKDYPDIEYEDILVDACAMHLILRPGDFDVIVTENMFGDILSDEASMLAGSMGMLPSASLAEGAKGLYEPIHGSAPDIAGKGIANPLAAILSSAMLLRTSLGLQEEAAAIEAVIDVFLAEGYRTADLAYNNERTLSTTAVGDFIAEGILQG